MIRKLLIIASILVFIPSETFSQSEQLVINITQTSLPGQLTFENPKGSIKVTGYDGEVILVTGTLRFREAEKIVNNGMKRIDQNALDISAEVNGNNVTLQCRTIGKTVDFDIKVPRNFSLKLKSLDNGIVEIFNINGEIEVEDANGDIKLENISGSAVLSSVYGKISAVFREVNPNSPMMFTSFEGDITLTFPTAINARLKMKSEKGEILSDFDIKPVKRQSVVTRVENSRIYSLEDWVVGSINTEGPEYIIKNYNGDIYLRKK
jgi:Putative adhesin